MGDGEKTPLRLQFNPKVRLEFHGATITSDAGLLPIRELDDALGLTPIASDYLQESRTGRNIRHHLVPLLRQSIYSRLAGYDDTNDAERLSQDPAMRVVVAPAEELRHHSYIARATWVNDAIHRLKGEWEAAKKFSGHGLATSPFDPRLLLSRILSEHEVGAFSEGDGYLQRLRAVIEEMEPGPSVEFAFCSMAIPLVARITGNNDRLEIADAAAEAVISSNSGARLWTELARIGKGMLAVQRGDAVKARENYRAFTSADTTHISTFIAFDRLLGLLAQTMGEPNTAATHFHDALALCRKAGYRPELAWTCCDYADLLLERSSNEPGRGGSGTAPADAEDRAKGMALLEESLAISTELGMRPLMERVLSRLEILGA